MKTDVFRKLTKKEGAWRANKIVSDVASDTLARDGKMQRIVRRLSVVQIGETLEAEIAFKLGVFLNEEK